MRIKLTRIVPCILLIFLFFIPTLWAQILDQSQTLENGGVAFWSDSPIVQTFTPSITGYLDTLSLYLSASGSLGAQGLIEPVHIAITEWDGLSPQAILGQVDTTLTVPTRRWMDYDFSSQNVMLSAETMYAILLWNDLSLPVDPYSLLSAHKGCHFF